MTQLKYLSAYIAVALALPIVDAAPLAPQVSDSNPLQLVQVSRTNGVLDATYFTGYWTNEANYDVWQALSTYNNESLSFTDSELIMLANTIVTSTFASDVDAACSEIGDLLTPAIQAAYCVPTSSDAPISGGNSENLSLEKRSRWRWLAKTTHATGTVALNLLSNYLYDTYKTLPSSPRDVCVSASGQPNACISWSKTETFNTYYAGQFASDGLSFARDQGLTSFSLQTNNALGTRTLGIRSAADVCLSNRADGCT